MTMNTSDATASATRAITERWSSVLSNDASEGRERVVRRQRDRVSETRVGIREVPSRKGSRGDRQHDGVQDACGSDAGPVGVAAGNREDYTAAAKRMFEIYSSFLTRAPGAKN